MVKNKLLNLNKNYMIQKYDTEYINDRIEAKLISKITYYRNKINEDFQLRHRAEYPELHYTSLKANIRNLKTWIQMAYLIRAGNIVHYGSHFYSEPTAVKMAKQLSK